VRAVLGGGAIAEHADQSAHYSVVRGPVKALEIRGDAGFVLVSA